MNKCYLTVLLLLLSGCPPVTQIIRQEVNLPPGTILPSGSPSASPTPDPAAKALVQVIHDNANALNSGDEAKYIATFHADSEFLIDKSFYDRLRNQFMTRYNIVETRIQSQSDDSASVMVKRRTSDYTGTIEQDVLYALRKSGNSWKISTMVIQAFRPVS